MGAAERKISQLEELTFGFYDIEKQAVESRMHRFEFRPRRAIGISARQEESQAIRGHSRKKRCEKMGHPNQFHGAFSSKAASRTFE